MFEAHDISPRVGTRITISKADLTSGKYAGDIEELLKTRSALVFKELFLEDEEQLAFANTIGTVTLLGDDGVSKISLDPTVSDTADYTRGAFFWHIDGANDVYPAKATMLTAKTLSEWGGDTLIANTYAAYDDLPDADKELLSTLKVRHALEASQRMVHPDPSYAELQRWRTRPSQTHPLVWHHADSGLKSLVLGATAYYVHDMSREDSDALLCRVQEWATQDRFVYRHKWNVGDLLVWDNTGTMHRADTYSLESKRLMHRTTLEGEEALG
ncbi:TauD/TfdA family dioxygenase [Sphingobium sufflavum]|uniref:TauD/TfdA dioxygenase family protein n=1 Tax=Sphingobium sufflavum TaxID=1129547 RepID=UPI001F366B1E|nr:TauD/TfdA family dioxygenase [Sphingobium sufflavum]MCE7798618.1 TauD/TfdA family dioxygenase [Sphingobium sufflavum]